jgi:two-component system OmpR family sensor kinase
VQTDRPAPGRVRVRITDDGPGIAPENMARVFDVNFTTRQGAAGFGLGIGLPICKEIVERHGGSLTVTSRPGATCFCVELPFNPSEELV